MTDKWLIILGLLMALIGAILAFAPGLFRWFGKLPGDIRIEGNGYVLFIPVTSMLIASLILTVLIHWLSRG